MVDFDELLTGNSCYSLVKFRALILEADDTGCQSIYLRTGYKFPGSYGYELSRVEFEYKLSQSFQHR